MAPLVCIVICDSYRWPGPLRCRIICSHGIDYGVCGMNGPVSPTAKDFDYRCHFSVQTQNYEYMFIFSEKSSARKRLTSLIPAPGYRLQATSFDICSHISIGRSLSVCRLIDAQRPSSGHGDLIVVVGCTGILSARAKLSLRRQL